MAQTLSIQIISPLSGETVTRGMILTHVQVTLDCGLPACAGGRFDPARFDVRAILSHKDIQLSDTILSYKRDTGLFEGKFGLREPGEYALRFEAYDPETGLAGRNSIKFSMKTA